MKVDREMSLQRAAVPLFLHLNGQTHTLELARQLGMSPAAGSRHVQYWTEKDRHEKEGQGWVRYVEDPTDKRVKRLELTEKGVKELEGIFKG